jgi:predicted HicB family RNase H-like nuclease
VRIFSVTPMETSQRCQRDHDIMIVNEGPEAYRKGMAAKKEPAKEAEQKFVLRLPEGLHRALRHVSIDRRTSLNAMIIEALEAWWSKQPERERSGIGEDATKRPNSKARRR